MMLRVSFLIFTIYILVAELEAANVCPREFVLIGRKCYRFSHEPLLDYYAAIKYCKSLDAELVKIAKAKDFRRLYQYLTLTNADLNENYWIEGIDLRGNGHFIWQSTNKEMPYKLWSPNHQIDKSSENTFHKCVLLVRDENGRLFMETKACSYPDNFICEKPSGNKRQQSNSEEDSQKSGCERNFNRIGKNCYLFTNFGKEFDRAAEHCLALNSNLLIIDQPQELQHLNTFLNKHKKSLGDGYWVAFRATQHEGYDVTLIDGPNDVDLEQLQNYKCVPREINGAIYYFRHSSCQKSFEEHKFICKSPLKI